MKRKYGEITSDNAFLKKKDCIWIVIVVVGVAAVAAALSTDIGIIRIKDYVNLCCGIEMKCKIWLAAEVIYDIIVTYSTMLVAIVVFFYSVIDNKRLGIPYRRLIMYTIGSRTIPVLFMETLVLTVFMAAARCMPWRYTTCVCEVYILAVQIFVIMQILKSTSYNHCKRVICQIEWRRYCAGIGVEHELNTEWAYFFGHLERAVHSEEFLPDKKELFMDILGIPFCRFTGRPYKKEIYGMRVIKAAELERIYQFYFVNMLSAFQNFDGEEKHLERSQLYQCITNFILDLLDKSRNVFNDSKNEYTKENRKRWYIFHMVLSGIMNGLISSNVEDSIDYCKTLFTKCLLDQDVNRRQLYLFVLFQEVFSMIDVQRVSRRIQIAEFGEWKQVEKEDIEFLAEFWQIWTKMYDISSISKMTHFECAMQTMSGHKNSSITILRMMLTMKEKNAAGEKNNG